MHELPFSNLNVTSMDVFVLIFVSRTTIQKTVVTVLAIMLLVNLLTAHGTRTPSRVQVRQRQAVDQLYLFL